jgi:hypothetical protein
MDIPNSVEIIDSHLSKFFDDDEVFVLDEIVSEIIHSDIYVIKPSKTRKYYILMTCGLSALPMKVPEEFDAAKFIEIVMLLPSTWNMNFDEFDNENNYWPIRTLKELSKYPHLNGTWLGYGHTIGNDEFYSTNNKFNAVVLLNSMTLSKDFMNVNASGKQVRIFSAFPIYKEELEFKQEYGTEALIDKFEEYKINEIVDIKRSNTCV